MGSLIYTVDTPTTFELDANSKKDKVDEFIGWVDREYGYEMVQFFTENYDAILENKLQHQWKEFPAGMKLSKVLMKKFGLEAEDVRQKLSMLIQSNKVTGTLCLSVHPLDYLSASENTHGWRSCHALDGEYRAGNVSYMADRCTIMAYLRSDEDTRLPNFPADVPWNDKKWRCYFYVDNDNQLIYAARQYPFHTDAGLKMVADLLHQFHYFDERVARDWNERVAIMREHPWGHTFTKEELELPYSSFRHWGIRGETKINDMTFYFDQTKVVVGPDGHRKVVPMDKFIKTDPEACCFNDVIQSHTYAPYIMNYDFSCDYMPERVSRPLVVGAACNCVTCGQRPFGDSDTFQCHYCRGDEGESDDYEYEDDEAEVENEPQEEVVSFDAPSPWDGYTWSF